MDDHCDHLKEFLEIEIEVIKRHLDEHKYCNHIANANDGVQDFIVKYGWLMREFYCNYVCAERKNCVYKNSKGETSVELKIVAKDNED